MSQKTGEVEETKQVKVSSSQPEPDTKQNTSSIQTPKVTPSAKPKPKKDETPSVVPKIGQSSFSKFSRENHNRHRSERLIDRYLVKSEKEEALKYLEKLKLLQKINQKFEKQRQLEEEELRKQQEEAKKKEIEDRREKFKDLDHYKALLRIMKFIQKPGKYSKCLNLLKELLQNNIDFFDHNTLLNVFDTLVKQDVRADSEEDRKILQDLYSMFCEYAYMEQDQFVPEQLAMLENYIIPIHIEGQFFTDDTYQFNQAVKALENVFDDLKIYDEDHDRYKQDFENKNKVYEHLKDPEDDKDNDLGIVQNTWMYEDTIEDFWTFNAFIKRKYFFGALKTLFPLHKNAWAKNAIKRFLQNIYKEKEKLSEEEVEEVIKMMDQINDKVSSNLQYLDSKIISNAARSVNPVADGRGSRLVVDNLGAWNKRQFGS